MDANLGFVIMDVEYKWISYHRKNAVKLAGISSFFYWPIRSPSKRGGNKVKGVCGGSLFWPAIIFILLEYMIIQVIINPL